MKEDMVTSEGLPTPSHSIMIGSTNYYIQSNLDYKCFEWWYWLWRNFILLPSAVCSSFVTPVEFGFFRGRPEKLFVLDMILQIVFPVHIALQLFIAYRDHQIYGTLFEGTRTARACRYAKHGLIIVACMPLDLIYKGCGHKEIVRCLLWSRLYRVWIVKDFLQTLEKNIHVNYFIARILKLIAVEVYYLHTAACIYYYLATTVPESQEGYTWIGSLQLGGYSYSRFREIDFWRRYFTSFYFAIITLATIGYGDIHAVNTKEMIFIIFYVTCNMLLGAYLIGNMTALVVNEGSKTEKFRDRMTYLNEYMKRNKLGKDIREQIKGHVRLQFERSYTNAAVIQDVIPISVRSKISQTFYLPYIKEVSLFRGCSSKFMNQIVTRLHEEFFLPGEVIMEQGNVVDQLYFVCHGVLEEVGTGEDGSTEETVSLVQRNSSFGEISVLCNIPQPYTVRVCQPCRVLRLDKQSFFNIMDIYFYDRKKVLNNLSEVKESFGGNQLESDITFHIGKLEAELVLKVNRAAFDGDLNQLKGLVRAGADLNKTDYDGRSPLHLAACRGHHDITLFLIQKGVDIDIKDNFGNTPLLEAVKNGHDWVASLLVRERASMKIENGASFLTRAVLRGDSDYVKRLLVYGMDPNLKDYDYRTPLHVAAAEGLIFMAKLLLEAGASVFTKDRWGDTPLDEARMSGNENLIKLLEDARCSQLSEIPCSQEFSDKMHPKKCTVFSFHPWDPKEERKNGIVLWVPHTIEELIKKAAEQIGFSFSSDYYCILSEDAGKITDVGMINDDQKLYLVHQTR